MVRIEDFSEDNLPLTYLWMQNEALKKNFLFRRNLTLEGHATWYGNYLNDSSQKIFAIYYKDQYVGNVGLKNIDTINRNAETWIYIGDESMKGKGIGILAYHQLFVKNKSFLHKLYANIVSFNESSLKMYQKSGFVQEGDFKDQLMWDDQFYSIKRYAYYL
jgi:RimJ/RimL family protein N-acetyltransferase